MTYLFKYFVFFSKYLSLLLILLLVLVRVLVAGFIDNDEEEILGGAQYSSSVVESVFVSL